MNKLVLSFGRLIGVFLLSCVTLFSAVADSTRPTSEQVEMYMSYLTNTSFGVVMIAGQVLDSQGVELSDVNVQAVINRYGSRDIESYTVDGTFSFAWSNCASVGVSLSKDEHEPWARDFVVSGSYADGQYIGTTLSETNLAITLSSVSHSTVLRPLNVFLKCSPPNIWQGLRLEDGHVLSTENDPCVTVPSSNVLFLVCATNDSGGILLEENSLPQDVRLSGVESKALLYATSSSHVNCFDALRSMTVAPEDNYADFISVDPTHEFSVFYLRIQSDDSWFYGKGCLGPVLQENGSLLQADVQILIQTNGTRNLSALNIVF